MQGTVFVRIEKDGAINLSSKIRKKNNIYLMNPENISVRLISSLNGGFPVDLEASNSRLEINKLWYKQACHFADIGDLVSLAEKLKYKAEAFFSTNEKFSFSTEKIYKADTIKFFQPSAKTIGVRADKILIFRWIEAEFFLSIPKQKFSKWLVMHDDGLITFDCEYFENWMEANDTYLQDGVRYSLGDIWYDLEGMGANSCVIEEIAFLGKTIYSRNNDPSKKIHNTA